MKNKHKQFCLKCGKEMELFGITDKGYYKYYCDKCHDAKEEEDESKSKK